MKLSKVIRQLEALERHHKILGAVACGICGGPMTFMSSGQRGTKYSCEGAIEECKKGEWMVTSPEWDHFCKSEIIVDYDRAKIHEDAARFIRNVLEGREWSYHPEAEEFEMWLGMTGLFGFGGHILIQEKEMQGVPFRAIVSGDDSIARDVRR